MIIRLSPDFASLGRALVAQEEDSNQEVEPDEDIDVPEELEGVLEHLIKALQDKVNQFSSFKRPDFHDILQDTIVRYSAAKGIARISERLPSEFVDQILDNVLHLFTIHSIGLARIYEMPAIAEGTWHGTCLACAEMARRGLIADERLGELLEWLIKVSTIASIRHQ